jgi:glucokinase
MAMPSAIVFPTAFEEIMMILAGDIGGTKTILALFSREQGIRHPLRQQKFPSSEHNSLESIIGEFLAETSERPTAASFGVAGPVINRKAYITNLPWVIDADEISKAFAIPKVHLLNDLQAIATAVPHLAPDDVCTLNAGHADPGGTIGVIAPGTGLGEAFLVWSGVRYQAYPTEGGHTSFAPVTHEQSKLLSYLQTRFGHVSFERVCSGSGIPNLYDYMLNSARYEEPEWLQKALTEAQDPTPVIVNTALARKAQICVATLDLYTQILAGVVGDMALKVFATGGLYLGGGIPPRILPCLQSQDFFDAVTYKGRFRDWVARIPIHVILNPSTALHGAAWHGLQTWERGAQSSSETL